LQPPKEGREPITIMPGSTDKPSEYDLREEFLDRLPCAPGGWPPLAHDGSDYYWYTEGAWGQCSDLHVRREISLFLENLGLQGVQINPSSSLEKNLLDGLKSRVYKQPEEWDADPDLLVFEDCAYRVSTGEKLPHSSEYYVTARLPYPYPDGQRSELWERTVTERLGKEEAAFFQEFAGYSLTPSTEHQLMLWLVGAPGGGKSTLIDGVRAMLGPKCGTLGLGKLQGPGAQFALGNLLGKTLMTCNENPGGYIKTTETLNSIVSGDTVQVERKYKDSIDYRPKAKLLWAMNKLPKLQDPNNGLFRRTKILEVQSLIEGRCDPGMADRIRGEAPGIFTWALEGLKRLNKRGHFDPPNSVQDASRRFRQENDLPANFLEERCERGTGPEYELYATLLHDAYNDWADKNGHPKRSAKALADEWRRLGLSERRASGGRLWCGVRLRTSTPM
jgi:putative DNA primase/helicase